jgi:hypothetical protein
VRVVGRTRSAKTRMRFGIFELALPRLIVVVTNQSGLGRNLVQERKITCWMAASCADLLTRASIEIAFSHEGRAGNRMIRMSVENPCYDYGRWPPRLGEAHAATTVRPLDARSRGRKMMGPVP